MHPEPVIFISHRHEDREIAERLASFMRARCAGKAQIHLSSSPNFTGPRFGKPLSSELKRALGQTELVVLVYTSQAQDWSWCMWECGVATDPDDERPTSVVVLQCTSDEPKPYADQMRVDARSFDSVRSFVKTLLTTTDLFPQREEAITRFEDREIDDYSTELHAKLAEIAPADHSPSPAEPTCPYVRVRLAGDAVERLRDVQRTGDAVKRSEIVETEARVADQKGTHALFDMRIERDAPLGEVLANWRSDQAHRDEEDRWFAALAEQIGTAVMGKFRPVKWAPYRSELGQSDLPFVASVRRDSAGAEFDVFFVPIAPRPVQVKERMLPIALAYHKDAAHESFDELLLSALLKDMRGRSVTRLPVLDDRRPGWVLHKATINEFLAQRALETGDVRNLTLADLQREYADILDQSYVEVPSGATMEEAMMAMNAKDGCQDVFVADGGAVTGWLTNIMFIEQ